MTSFPLPKFALIAAVAALTSACTTLPSFNQADYVTPFDGASVVENRSRYSQSLECLRPLVGGRGPTSKRYAVGRVSDFTGKEDLVNGKRITQGAALMVISALSKTGVPLVERFDTTIADMELKYADNKLITDNLETKAHRPIFSGSLPGSDYHVVGGITEVNYNIRSGSLESSIRFFGAAARYFVMNVAVDLRLINTKTLEVVNTQSLQKQIIGTELSGGYFRLFSDGLVDLNAAERTQEPIQKGVRMVIEQAIFNMLTETNNLSAQSCAQLSNPNSGMLKKASANRGNSLANPAHAAVSSTNPPQAGLTVDPHTGEIISATPPQAGAASQTEVSGLRGLFGTGAPQTAQNPDTSSNTSREMQEKMLWGNRPQIR